MEKFHLKLNQVLKLLIFASFICGAFILYLWMAASDNLTAHYEKAREFGLHIYEAKQSRDYRSLQKAGAEIKIANALINENDSKDVQFDLKDIPANYVYMSDYYYNASLSQNPTHIRIYKATSQFRIGDLKSAKSDIFTFADLSQILARACDDTILAMEIDAQKWLLIKNEKLWACSAKPFDIRWFAIILLIIYLSLAYYFIGLVANPFEDLSQIFSSRKQILNMNVIEEKGSSETRNIARAINKLLENEARKLAKRLQFFTAMSHDIGTPATRLRLRAELIEDDELRAKFIKDIEQLTQMTDASLHFMRHEVEKEVPRLIDFGSLIETIVNNYQDLGHMVTYQRPEKLSFDIAHSAFSKVVDDAHILKDKRIITLYCQPLNMQRAIENLIENGLKFGDAVMLKMEANAETITLTVIDNGHGVAKKDLNKITAAFYRGENADLTASDENKGFGNVGLGLAIVGNILDLHGGELSFENSAEYGGLEVMLTIPRLYDHLIIEDA